MTHVALNIRQMIDDESCRRHISQYLILPMSLILILD